MRLALRLILNMMSILDNQLDEIEYALLGHTIEQEKFKSIKKRFRQVIREFRELNDELGDNGIGG